jgi:hypothetical protein
MKVTELPEEIQTRLSHITNWQTLISDDVAAILLKLSNMEELTRSDNNLEVTPSEVAAIWSVTNGRAIDVRYVREVKRDERIQPSREWGAGPGRRSLYRVKVIKDIRIISTPGRHKGSKNRAKRNPIEEGKEKLVA